MSNESFSPYIQHISERKIPHFPGICYQCEFSIHHYSDDIVHRLLDAPLPDSLHSAVAKRKAEFVAGRYVSQQALIKLKSASTHVSIGKNREPLWPTPFIGSISHTHEFAICAVANKSDINNIGIDIEHILSDKTAREIVNSILTEPELILVGSLSSPDPTILTLIFSAKESLFKALYPDVGCFFDFDVAKIASIDFNSNKFTLELVKTLTPDLACGTHFEGVFDCNNDSILTAIFRTH